MELKIPEIEKELADNGIPAPPPKTKRAPRLRSRVETLTDRQRLIASMRAGGMSQKEIGEKLQISASGVSATLRLTHVRLFQSELRRDVTKEVVAELTRAITEDAMTNFEVIRSLRDDAEDDRIRLRAAEILFDRQAPAKQPVDARRVSVVINGESADNLISGLREAFDPSVLSALTLGDGAEIQ